ncbi:MAG TPA: Ppx/GppA phosphatase family protein [Verrucomicrobiae bacterium]|jgi:exopolyphosphatase/guanosine-5'-triphosphate,3'-diphosphate pyrophosphatase|nr:Ppx/GppA phosphatase family protein [Verrucomicrobiae bacterium]
MKSVRRAVIDVGTNSVKLLVADVEGQEVRPVIEESRQTRLGKNFYETRRLQPDAIIQTASAVAEFADMAYGKKSTSIRVFATSAARDAVNPDDLASAIAAASRLKLEIISGAQEADWAFQGATSGTDLANTPLLLLDVGGGSSEFILGHGGRKSFARSFPLGTVRLMEKCPHSDPPTPDEFSQCLDWVGAIIRQEIRPELDPVLRREKKSGPVQLAGTGGTATIFARMELKSDRFDREQIEGTRLSREKIQVQVKTLWDLPLAKRKEIPGLPKSRADVILTGALIYAAVMDAFGFDELRVSTKGLRFAAVASEVEPLERNTQSALAL